MADRASSHPPTFQDDPLTYEIIGAAIEVHRILGPGMLELPYEDCLSYELELRGLAPTRQVEALTGLTGLLPNQARVAAQTGRGETLSVPIVKR